MAIQVSGDTIDTREIIERITELDAQDERDEEETEELTILKAAIQELEENSGDSPETGITLIREDYFEDYARELAVDIGAISKDTAWPASCIDWEAAADQLQGDYSRIEIDGDTYYYR